MKSTSPHPFNEINFPTPFSQTSSSQAPSFWIFVCPCLKLIISSSQINNGTNVFTNIFNIVCLIHSCCLCIYDFSGGHLTFDNQLGGSFPRISQLYLSQQALCLCMSLCRGMTLKDSPTPCPKLAYLLTMIRILLCSHFYERLFHTRLHGILDFIIPTLLPCHLSGIEWQFSIWGQLLFLWRTLVQHQHGKSQLFVTLVSDDPTSPSGHNRHQECVCYKGIHVGKTLKYMKK